MIKEPRKFEITGQRAETVNEIWNRYFKDNNNAHDRILIAASLVAASVLDSTKEIDNTMSDVDSLEGFVFPIIEGIYKQMLEKWSRLAKLN